MRFILNFALALFLLAAGCSASSSSQGSSQGDAGSDAETLGDAHIVIDSGPSCHGTPSPCEGVSTSQCASAHGCTLMNGGCNGVADLCSQYNYASVLCTMQEGCTYDTTTMNCTGLATDCSLLSGSDACIAQNGCTWSITTCTGVDVGTCNGATQLLCSSVPGCFWL